MTSLFTWPGALGWLGGIATGVMVLVLGGFFKRR